MHYKVPCPPQTSLQQLNDTFSSVGNVRSVSHFIVSEVYWLSKVLKITCRTQVNHLHLNKHKEDPLKLAGYYVNKNIY